MALLPGVSFQWHTPRGLLPGASSQGALPNYILNGTNHDENMSFECERDAQCTFYNDYKRFWTKKHNLRCNCFENTHFGTKKHNFRCKCFENAHFEQKHKFQCKCFGEHWPLSTEMLLERLLRIAGPLLDRMLFVAGPLLDRISNAVYPCSSLL